jgi:Mg2+ and Co2+ transporter CorA
MNIMAPTEQIPPLAHRMQLEASIESLETRFAEALQIIEDSLDELQDRVDSLAETQKTALKHFIELAQIVEEHVQNLPEE